MPTNVETVDKFAIDESEDEFLHVELIEDYTQNGFYLACRSSITFTSRGDEIWSFGILDAEQFYNALGEAIQAAKNSIDTIKSAQQAQFSRPEQPGTMAQGSVSGDGSTGG